MNKTRKGEEKAHGPQISDALLFKVLKESKNIIATGDPEDMYDFEDCAKRVLAALRYRKKGKKLSKQKIFKIGYIKKALKKYKEKRPWVKT